jgi:hypothetical protein
MNRFYPSQGKAFRPDETVMAGTAVEDSISAQLAGSKVALNQVFEIIVILTE